ncbi:MAG: hypothetical protein DRR19_33475, partial [Candidatus Parabeggiatoa sp. nov. 1]
EVIRLLESIHFDTVIFYIPLSIQNQFVKLVNQQFHITEWQEDNTVKFSEDRLIGNDALSRFFSKMRLIVGLTPKKACSEELIEAMNKIVSDDNNPIEAIFVYEVKNEYLLCKTENSAKPGTLQKYNLKSIVESLGSLKNDGLKRDILEFDDSIIVLFLVRDSSNSARAIVGFVTVGKEERLGNFLYFCDNYFGDIKNSLIEEDNDSAG